MEKTKINELKQKIEEAVNDNPFCNGNKMLKNRVFHRIENHHLEILVSLNNKTKSPHHWGHLYFTDGVYISHIVAIDCWMNPLTEKQLFWYFYHREKGSWYPIRGDTLRVSKNCDDAVKCLAKLIKNFTGDNPKKSFDNRVVMMYPFPKIFED